MRYTLTYTAVSGSPLPTGKPAVICDVETSTSMHKEQEALTLRVRVNGVERSLEVLDPGPPVLLLIDGTPTEVICPQAGQYQRVGRPYVMLDGQTLSTQRAGATSTHRFVAAPMPGRVVRVLCAVGQAVQPGTPLLVLEAMKMENELNAPQAATVKRILVAEGSAVEARANLVELE